MPYFSTFILLKDMHLRHLTFLKAANISQEDIKEEVGEID